ncbi:MAG TPA: replication-relaxation family protein [Bacillales bacterium]|nr:replication-relaxation family protein [Bacillales bacterium]
MTLRKRDRAIIDALNRFRCLSRDQIAAMYFDHVKHPVKNANDVLKRLRRDGYIDANTDRQPYVYFPEPSAIRKDSQKVDHYLAIAGVYIEMTAYEQPREFVVEPRYGADYMEPDAFVRWRGAPWFIEVQRSVYSDKVMNAKFNRYRRYFASNEWRDEPWQPKGRAVFPRVLLIAPTRYAVNVEEFRVFQAPSVQAFVESVK